MNETRISIPVKCRFAATKSKEVERERERERVQSRATQGRARQGRAEREQGREGREEMNFFGSDFRHTDKVLPAESRLWPINGFVRTLGTT
jgi:hypothetical protein